MLNSRCLLGVIGGVLSLAKHFQFSCLSVHLLKFETYTQSEITQLHNRFLRVTFDADEFFVPLGGYWGCPPLHGPFTSLSVLIFKFVTYSQLESPLTVQVVSTCYVGRKQSVRSICGAIWGWLRSLPPHATFLGLSGP